VLSAECGEIEMLGQQQSCEVWSNSFTSGSFAPLKHHNFQLQRQPTQNWADQTEKPNHRPRMAAKPVLASDLIAKDSIGLFEERARKRPRVGTQCCASVDDALSGGLVYGQDGIYNISGATGSRAAETVSEFP